MLHIIIPILVGAVIGYFTNYIAIKMLFRPRKPVYIGRWQLPFTQGVIPKNQSRIAEAVGNAVSGSLVTAEDLTAQIQNSPLKEMITDGICRKLFQSDLTARQALRVIPNGEEMKDTAIQKLTDGIVKGLADTDLTDTVEEICSKAFGNLLSSPLVAMFLSADKLKAMYAGADRSIKEYASGAGREKLEGFIRIRIDNLLDSQAGEGLEKAGIDEEAVRQITGELCGLLLTEALPRFIGKLDIRRIVVDKINAMPVDELEKLVMSVMKNELQAIVSLGALIGAVIGIINVFA